MARPEPADGRRTIVIIGGGFSGAMTAAQILRGANQIGSSVHVMLVERRGTVGEGLAYATREPMHLLNVPAAKMSAWPDRPDDFVTWAQQRDTNVLPGDFLPRQWYGTYVHETLLATATEASRSAKLSIISDEVLGVRRHAEGGWVAELQQAVPLRAEAVVLAIGHRAPSDPIGANWEGPRTRFIGDPWLPSAVATIRPSEAVVVLGSGLTALDAVLSLAVRKHAARITLVSRNGLLPQRHAVTPVPPADLQGLVETLTALPSKVRARALLCDLRRMTRSLGAEGLDWRSVIDGLRPHTARLWQGMPVAERRRFLSRLRPFWETHRHRMAPPAAERLDAMLECGELKIWAGRVISVKAGETEVRVTVKPRGIEEHHELSAAWVINCTGPMPANRPESNPVIGSLLTQGQLCLDELALGVETTAAGNAIASGGAEVPDMFVVGTLRKPAVWESTAVPELRGQAATVAERILDRLMFSSQTEAMGF